MVTLPNQGGRSSSLVSLLPLLGVITVLINHLPISLLHTSQPVLPLWLTRDLPEAGITLIFICSGHLLHRVTSHRTLSTTAGRVEALGTLLTALALLCPTVWLCLAADLLVSGYPIIAKSNGVIHALPFSATLTQNWSFQTLGDATLVAPFTSSNVTWLGGSLLFVILLYVFASALINRIRRAGSGLIVVLILAALYIGFHAYLQLHRLQINAEAISTYGPLAGGPPSPPAFSYFKWLEIYAPWSRIPEFFLGVTLARIGETHATTFPSTEIVPTILVKK